MAGSRGIQQSRDDTGGFVVYLADGGGETNGIELGEVLEDILLMTTAGLHLGLDEGVVAEDGAVYVVISDGRGEAVFEWDGVLFVSDDGVIAEADEVALDDGCPGGEFVVGGVVFVGGGGVEVASVEFAHFLAHNRKCLETK